MTRITYECILCEAVGVYDPEEDRIDWPVQHSEIFCCHELSEEDKREVMPLLI